MAPFLYLKDRNVSGRISIGEDHRKPRILSLMGKEIIYEKQRIKSSLIRKK